MNIRVKPAAVEAPPSDRRVEPQFKVVSLGGERKAFRLEGVFWTAMETIARLNRRSLPAEIAATLAKAGPGSNQSAYLRARCAADLLDLWSVAEARSAAPAWDRVIDTMPCAAFVASRTGRVLKLNAAMVALLARKDVAASNEVPPGLELAAQVAARLKDGDEDTIVCNAVFRQGERRAVVRARLVNAGPDARSMVLGFADDAA
ncbi:MAG TPA: ribbon-helix-helix domain-containing protein [Caulobacteraceae bacterium]|nr:ribbon-helix-helix domain-containing protein [Caulobacteraceae bacterium]